MKIAEFAHRVLGVRLTDYQRAVLENIPERMRPAGVPREVRLPFLPVVRAFTAAQLEAYENGAPTIDGETRTNAACIERRAIDGPGR